MVDKYRRKKKLISDDVQVNIMVGVFIVLVLAAVVGIRIWIIGGWNECFWAEDVGICLSILNNRQ